MANSTYKIVQSRKDVTPALFVVASGLQNLGDPVYGLEISQAMQHITGKKAVCIQKAEGVWRLTTQTKAERAKILLSGLTIRGHTITVLSTNPRLVNGERTIRLNIGNVPYDVQDSDVMTALELLGLKFGSELKYEFYRDDEKNPTDIKTGRRYISIAPPPKPLPDMVKVADDKYRAFLQYNRKDVHGTGLKDNPRPDPTKNHNDSSGTPWTWPPTGWRKPAVGYGHSQDPWSDSESEEDLSKLPSAAPYGWQPRPRHGFPPRPTVDTQAVPNLEAQLGEQVQANLDVPLLGSNNNKTTSHTGDCCIVKPVDDWSCGGFWSNVPLNPPSEPQQDNQIGNFAPDQPSLANTIDNENLNFSNKSSDTMCEDDFLNQTSLQALCEDIGIVHIPIEHNTDGMITSCAESSNVIVTQTPLDSSKLCVSLDIDSSHVQENNQMLPTPPICIESGSSESTSILSALDVANHSLPANDSWDWESSADNGSLDTHTSAKGNPSDISMSFPQNDHTVVEREMEVLGTDTISPPNNNQQHDLVPGTSNQLTLDNFTSFKSRRARSVTRNKLSESRERSSSKRKIGSPKETSKGKRSTKNKKSPQQKIKKGIELSEQDRVSKGTLSDGNTGGNIKSAEYFDYWLNKSVRTSPT